MEENQWSEARQKCKEIQPQVALFSGILRVMLHHADDHSFDQEVRQSHLPVLVEFFTPSCGPCRQLEPHLQKLANDFANLLKVVKVNSNQAQQTAMNYGVRMAPTLILFRNGTPLQAINGNPGPHRLREFAQSALR